MANENEKGTGVVQETGTTAATERTTHDMLTDERLSLGDEQLKAAQEKAAREIPVRNAADEWTENDYYNARSIVENSDKTKAWRRDLIDAAAKKAGAAKYGQKPADFKENYEGEFDPALYAFTGLYGESPRTGVLDSELGWIGYDDLKAGDILTAYLGEEGKTFGKEGEPLTMMFDGHNYIWFDKNGNRQYSKQNPYQNRYNYTNWRFEGMPEGALEEARQQILKKKQAALDKKREKAIQSHPDVVAARRARNEIADDVFGLESGMIPATVTKAPIVFDDTVPFLRNVKNR